MERLPYGRYTKEFRQEAVKQIKQIIEEGLSVHEVAKRLSLASSTISNWVKAYKAGKLGEVGKNYRPLTELEMELRDTKAAHKRDRGVCGAEKLQKEMEAFGTYVGICRIKRIKREQGLYCKQTKKYKATTDSAHNLPIADNLLKQEFKAASPNKAWVSDITYISTEEGWLYLAGHKDIWNGEIMESFWGTLKQELVHHRKYKTRQEAMQDISEYIEVFYNRQRRQARLGYLSPVAYEKKFYQTRIAA